MVVSSAGGTPAAFTFNPNRGLRMLIETYKITLTCDECSRTSEYATGERQDTLKVAHKAGWHVSALKDLCKTCKEELL